MIISKKWNNKQSVFPWRWTYAIIWALIYCMAPVYAADLDGQRHEKDNYNSKSLSKRLAESLSHISFFEIVSKHQTGIPSKPSLNKNLHDLQTSLFTSTSPVLKINGKNSYLHYSLSIMTYIDSPSAQNSFKELFVSADPNTGLSYAWDYAVQVGPHLYWLQAPCMLSKLNWQKLKAPLQRLVSSNKAGQLQSFECFCGQNCRNL